MTREFYVNKKGIDPEAYLIEAEHTGAVQDKPFLVPLILCMGTMFSLALNQAIRTAGVVSLGIVFIAASVAGLLRAKRVRPDEKLFPAALMVLGLQLFLKMPVMHILRSTGSYTERQLDGISAQLGCLLVLMLGLMLTAFPVIGDKIRRKNCSQPVNAVCIGLFKTSIQNTIAYYPVWEYSVYGEMIRNGNARWANAGFPDIGDVREIRVNPDDPEQVYCDNTAVKVLLGILGVALIAVSVYVGLKKAHII